MLDGLAVHAHAFPPAVEEAIADVLDALIADGFEGRLLPGSFDAQRNWAQHGGRATVQFGACADCLHQHELDAAGGAAAMVALAAGAHAGVRVEALPVWLVQLIDHLVDSGCARARARLPRTAARARARARAAVGALKSFPVYPSPCPFPCTLSRALSRVPFPACPFPRTLSRAPRACALSQRPVW